MLTTRLRTCLAWTSQSNQAIRAMWSDLESSIWTIVAQANRMQFHIGLRARYLEQQVGTQNRKGSQASRVAGKQNRALGRKSSSWGSQLREARSQRMKGRSETVVWRKNLIDTCWWIEAWRCRILQRCIRSPVTNENVWITHQINLTGFWGFGVLGFWV